MNAILRFLLCLFLLTTSTMAVQPEEDIFTQAELDQMLAPVALFPDALLSHVLIAATYPLEIVEAARWSRDHPKLLGQDAVNAVENRAWDASVKALVATPRLLEQMDGDLEWTRRLGDAFLLQEEQVLDTIQSLRRQAHEAGSLQNMEHARLIRERGTYVIAPADPQIIYVPYYSTRVVYGNWRWASHPPVYWSSPVGTTYYGGGFFVWGSPCPISRSYFFSTVHWPRRQIIIVQTHQPRTVIRGGYRYSPHDRAPRWQHNPEHRRGVAYRSERLNERYRRTGSSDEARRTTTVTRREWQSHYGERHRSEDSRGERRHVLPGERVSTQPRRHALPGERVSPQPRRHVNAPSTRTDHNRPAERARAAIEERNRISRQQTVDLQRRMAERRHTERSEVRRETDRRMAYERAQAEQRERAARVNRPSTPAPDHSSFRDRSPRNTEAPGIRPPQTRENPRAAAPATRPPENRDTRRPNRARQQSPSAENRRDRFTAPRSDQARQRMETRRAETPSDPRASGRVSRPAPRGDGDASRQRPGPERNPR